MTALRPKRYLGHLDGYDLSEAEKVDLLGALWLIVQGFADRSFGLSPLQQSEEMADGSKFPNGTGTQIELVRIDGGRSPLHAQFALSTGSTQDRQAEDRPPSRRVGKGRTTTTS